MKSKVYNLIILDESGSMKTIRRTTVVCFDRLIRSIREQAAEKPDLEQHLAFFSFNSERIREQVPLVRVDASFTGFDESGYRPRSLTPLYDAIGHATGKLRVLLSGEEDYAVLVTILTDGAENSSYVYNSQTIASIIRQLALQDWVFTYIGTNQDVDAEAGRIGIRNAMSFRCDDDDLMRCMDRELEHRRSFYRSLTSGEYPARRDRYFDEAVPDLPHGALGT